VILLWGLPGDRPLEAVREALQGLGAPFRVLDQRDASACEVTINARGLELGLELEQRGVAGSLHFSQVDALYLRPIETARALPAALVDDPYARQRAERVDRAIITWADLTDSLVINPPEAMAPNNSKPYQLAQIAGYGFDVPATLVTTDASAVRAFAARHGRVIYKSVSGVRSIVNVLGDAQLERLADVANAPTQFQEYVPGTDVRVHVVGAEVYATQVRSRAHDYRYPSVEDGDLTLSAIELPAKIAQGCQTMATGMNLHVAGIDLRLTPAGRWVAFEVNPSPAFVYYEAATGQPIANAIARLLCSGGHELPDKRRQRRVGVTTLPADSGH